MSNSSVLTISSITGGTNRIYTSSYLTLISDGTLEYLHFHCESFNEPLHSKYCSPIIVGHVHANGFL